MNATLSHVLCWTAICVTPIGIATQIERSIATPPAQVAQAELASPLPLCDAERAALARAQAQSPELGHQRAGDLHLSDRDVKIIVGAVLLTLLIVIIA